MDTATSDKPKRERLTPGRVLAGFRIIERAPGACSMGHPIYRVECVDCGASYERSSNVLHANDWTIRNGKRKRHGCEACGKQPGEVAADFAAERRAEIVRRYAGGETLDALAEAFKITRQRIQQVVSKYAPPWLVDRGLAEADRESLIAALAQMSSAVRRRVFLHLHLDNPATPGA